MITEFTEHDIRRIASDANNNMRKRSDGLFINLREQRAFAKEVIMLACKEMNDEIDINGEGVEGKITAKMNKLLSSVSSLRKACHHPKGFNIVESHEEYQVVECPICYLERFPRK
ncbi:hypothetical protein N9948_01890 [bacterium]|nr:hypothetical protein [bacterium]